MSPHNGDLVLEEKNLENKMSGEKETRTGTSKGSAEMNAEPEYEKTDLEDVLDLIGVGRYTYVVLFISCYSLLSSSTEAFGVGLIVTSAQCELDLDTYRKGIIGAVPMLGIIASSHAWGYVADTRGRRYAMLIALSGCWILGLASSFVTHWIGLAVIKFFSVIFASGANAVAYAFVVEMTPKLQRNRYMMLISTALMMSQTVIGVLGYITLRYDFNIPFAGILVFTPWRLMCQVFALVNLVAMLMFLILVHESPKFYLSQGKEKEGLEVLRKIYVANTGNKPETFMVNSIIMHEDTNAQKEAHLLRSMWNQTAPLFQRKYIKTTLTIMYIAAVAYSTAPPIAIWLPHVVNAFMRASPDALVEDTFCGRVVSQLKANNDSMRAGVCNDKVEDFALYTMMTLGCFITIIGVITTVLVKLVGKKTLVIILNLVSAVGTIALNHIFGNAAMVAFLSIVSNSMVMGILPAFAVEIFPTYLRSMAVCLTIMAGRGFSFIVINIMGAQIENNCIYFFYGYGVFIFSSVLMGFFLPGEQKVSPNSKGIEEK